MKKLTKKQIKRILIEKGFDIKISWFYIQFRKKFEEEFLIYETNLDYIIKGLVKFLHYNKINEVLFFPEPKFDLNIPSAIVGTKELEDFLKKNVNTMTNTHVSDNGLKWIFTLTHESDFFISGNKKLVKSFVSFFKDAKCIPYKEIEKKWSDKKRSKNVQKTILHIK